MNEINNGNKEKKSKSVCFTPIPINAALRAADDWLGKDLPWSPVNETQKEYLEKFFEKDTAEYYFVKRIASDKREQIKKFLADNGFPKMKVPEINPPSFAVAGIIDHIVKWLYSGKTTEMKGKDGNIYDAVEFEDDESFHVLKSSNYPHPIAVLNTKTEDKVYLTFLDNENDDETQFCFEITELSQLITNQLKEFPTRWKIIDSQRGMYFTNVIIPKIDFEGEVNMDWIVNMKNTPPWYISWAAMKVKLRLNHIGARAQASAVMIDTLGISLPHQQKVLKFDRPFMIWFTHQGKVTFVMYADYDCWKDPGYEFTLEMLKKMERKWKDEEDRVLIKMLFKMERVLREIENSKTPPPDKIKKYLKQQIHNIWKELKEIRNILKKREKKKEREEEKRKEERKGKKKREKRNIMVYQLNDQKAEFEQLKLDEGAVLYELLDPSLILLFLDPDNYKSWLWQGSEVSTRMKLISAKLAPTIRDQHGMMQIATVNDGNERMAFKILVGLEKRPEIEDFERSKLKRLGFWKTNFSSEVEEFMDENWSKTEQKEIVLFYLNSGKSHIGFLGSSTCRVCGMRNGSLECFSPDRKWTYPNGYCHYISSHNVKPPTELIADVMDWFDANEKIKYREWLKTLEFDKNIASTYREWLKTFEFEKNIASKAYSLIDEADKKIRKEKYKEALLQLHEANDLFTKIKRNKAKIMVEWRIEYVESMTSEKKR